MLMSFESFRISCGESTEWDSPLESLADWGGRSWTDRHSGAIYVPQLLGQQHRLGLQDRTRGTGLPRRGWPQVLLASGQGTLTAYFTGHIQSFILHSSFVLFPSSVTSWSSIFLCYSYRTFFLFWFYPTNVNFIFYYSVHLFHWRWSSMFRILYEVHLQGHLF